MVDVTTERVLVIPTELFHQLGHFQGFSPEPERYLPALLDPRNVSYRPRHEVEVDDRFKQLIPYVIFCHRTAHRNPRIFQYTRGTGQGEGRLHRKRSIGVGGHISADDLAADAQAHPYDEGLRRELAEEVRIETNYSERCVGLINDDATDVGRVHLGVVHLFEVERPEVHPCEPEMVESGFRQLSDLLPDFESFESWSQFCLRALFLGRLEA